MSTPQDQPVPTLGLWRQLWCREFRLDRRFSIGVILGWMTLAGIAFAVCERLPQPMRLYLRLLSLGAATILFQLVLPRRPRTACALAGLFVSLAWVVPNQSFWAPFGTISISRSLADVVGVALFGALLGYLVGAVATGIPILVSDILHLWAQRKAPLEATPWDDGEPQTTDGPPWSAAAVIAQQRRDERPERARRES